MNFLKKNFNKIAGTLAVVGGFLATKITYATDTTTDLMNTMFDSIWANLWTFITSKVGTVMGAVVILSIGIFIVFWGLRKGKKAMGK